MKNTSRLEGILKDPLSEASRKERRILLGISLLSFMVVEIGLIPTKIQALGIVLTVANQNAFCKIMVAVLVYYIFAFVIYGLVDFFAWRIAYNRTLPTLPKKEDDEMFESIRDNNNDGEELSRRSWFGALPSRHARTLSVFHILFEIFLPVLVGLYAVFILLDKIAKT